MGSRKDDMDSHDEFSINSAWSIAVGLCLGLAACPSRPLGTESESILPTTDGSEGACLPKSVQAAPCEELCPPNHRVGPCLSTSPAPTGWDTRALGNGYCAYEWTKRTRFTDVPQSSTPDCRVAAQEDPTVLDGGELVKKLVDGFNQGTCGFPTKHAADQVFHPTTELSSVMVAVVDTAPPGWADHSAGEDQEDGRGRHGRTMAAIVNGTACGPDSRSSCTTRVETFLGLPRLRDGTRPVPDDGRGGLMGLQSDLIEGLDDALAAWETAKLRAPNLKLIINLSVGWEPACDGASDAVRERLGQAVDAGALVLAASGNRTPGSCVEGPVAPAAWEVDGLVHGITPLDDRDQNLASFRPGSNTRIGALGYMAVVESQGEIHGPLSGSSVATAVVSGIAARVWAAHPEDASAAVMDRIWQYGRARAIASKGGDQPSAEYPPSANPPAQHVASLCRAMNTTKCNDALVGQLSSSWWEEMNAATCTSLDDEPISSEMFIECDSCEDPNATPAWVVPQPNIPPCPNCGVKGTNAYLRLATGFEGETLVSSTTITVKNAQDESATFSYGALTLSTNGWHTLEHAGFEFVDSAPVTKAEISMTFPPFGNNGSYTVGNVITVGIDPT